MAVERVTQRPQLIDNELLKRFAAECGVSEDLQLLVRESGGDANWDLAFEPPFIRVGRAPHCQLVLSDIAVSRRHAYLQALGGQLHCFDLESRGGLQWPAGPSQQGAIGTKVGVRIDPFELNLSTAESFDDAGLSDFNAVNTVADDYCLQFGNASGRKSGNSIRPTRRQITFLGSSRRCHVKLSHASVKKFHCSLVRTAESFWVVDLTGNAPIRVNGQEVALARIECDDELIIGRFQMRLCPTDPEQSWMQSGEKPLSQSGSHILSRSREPAPIEQPLHDGSGTVLMALMEQFAQLQQSMLEQNYQQTLLLAELLTAGNADPISDQLRKLEGITTELQALYSQNGDQQAQQPPVPPETLLAPKQKQEVEAPVPDRSELESLDDSPLPVSAQAGDVETTDLAEEVDEIEEVNDRENEFEEVVEHEPGDATAVFATVRVSEKTTSAAGDNHLWLSQRIRELERERQSGWQRVMTLLTGRVEGQRDRPQIDAMSDLPSETEI